ncbi:MAG TPA: aminotransferase class I/II-fold pyridoxal phosphate-dependent enzyme, partial [Micromonosporaceae bacterium]
MNPLTQLSLDQLRARRSLKWQTYPPDVLPMWVAEMDTPLAPPIAAALAEAIALGDTGYVMIGRLAEVFADFAERRFGWAPNPATMTLVPDVNAGIFEVARVFTSPGEAIVVDTPAYPPFFLKLRAAGLNVIENPMLSTDAGFVPDLDGLARAFEAGATAYLLCNPHNPTGAVLSRPMLEAIAELADRHGVHVMSDEVHAPLVYAGGTHVPFQTVDSPAARGSVTFVSASKAWNLAGLKAALAVPGPAAVEALAALPEDIELDAGLHGVLAGEVAFTEGLIWLEDLVAGLDHNRMRLAARLAEEVPDIGYRPPDATYLAWLDCRGLGLGDDPAAAFLER